MSNWHAKLRRTRRNMTFTKTTTRLLDCGHRPTNDTACLRCADETVREHLRAAKVGDRINGLYISSDREHVTTFTGGVVAYIDRVDRYQTGRQQRTPSGGNWTRFTWHATDASGGRWYGTNQGENMHITLRRVS